MLTFVYLPMTVDFDSVPREATLVVGVSGGCDSVALLHLLLEAGFSQIVVAHVDHQLREESKEDAEFVRGLASGLGLRCEVKGVDITELARTSQSGIEEAGRVARYEFFEDLRLQHGADFVVTAHHADDQVETVLLNIIRGCGLKGLAGMEVLSGTLWRPLLQVQKKELKAYCKAHGLEFREDASNEDDRFKRNSVRRHVIPHLKELNPRFLKTFEQNRTLWKSAASLFEQQAHDFLVDERVHDQMYDLPTFLGLHPVSQGETLRQLYAQIHGEPTDLQQAHLDQILKVLQGPVSGKRKEFGPGMVIVKQRGTFEICPA